MKANEQFKREIVEDTGHSRPGFGPSANCFSQLYKLDCGHAMFIGEAKNPKIGQRVVCRYCRTAAKDRN